MYSKVINLLLSIAVLEILIILEGPKIVYAKYSLNSEDQVKLLWSN
jgi:hypothetical protein